MSPRPRIRTFGRELPPMEEVSRAPDWRQASVEWIEGALDRALQRPSGGWFVVDASRRLRDAPRRARVAGRELVLWRDGATLRAAPDLCPHMGASLAAGRVEQGRLVCPWHGLELGANGHGEWCTLPAHDDGVLLWVRLDDELADGEAPSDTPTLPTRPERFLDAVTRQEAACEPGDILANRLDPWHGAHYHPHSFGRLKVVQQLEDEITVRVVYRVAGPYGVEVDARFHCPDPRTIVMTIVEGEGVGSVVETHATPIDRGRTAVVEATLATSDRPQFWTVVRGLGWALRPLVRWAAHRLWVEDAAYAERRHWLRRHPDSDPSRR